MSAASDPPYRHQNPLAGREDEREERRRRSGGDSHSSRSMLFRGLFQRKRVLGGGGARAHTHAKTRAHTRQNEWRRTFTHRSDHSLKTRLGARVKSDSAAGSFLERFLRNAHPLNVFICPGRCRGWPKVSLSKRHTLCARTLTTPRHRFSSSHTFEF